MSVNNSLDDANNCKICSLEFSCRHKSIMCDICNYWIHLKCTKLTLRQFSFLSTSDMPFYCTECLCETLPFCSIVNSSFKALFSSPVTKPSKVNCKKFNFKYPCTKCKKPCRSNQTPICYDACCGWTHLGCSSLSYSDFKNLSLDSPFLCNLCLSDFFPFDKLNNQQLFYLLNNDLDISDS